MRVFLSCVLIGYMLGFLSYQYDLIVADWIFYKLIPAAVSLDNAYVAFQSLKLYFSSHQSLLQSEAPTLHSVGQNAYAQLLPILGYDFLAQFYDLELLSYYLQSLDNNLNLSLDSILINAGNSHQYSHQLAFCISTFLPLPLSNSKQEFFSSIKLKTRLYTEIVRSNFINFYLKMVKITRFLN